MEPLMIFSETNIYILSKLVALVRRDTGTRHRLNSNDAIKHLLHDASRTADERIQSFYYRFLENLTPEQLVSFKAEGIQIPDQYMRKPGIIPTNVGRQYAYASR
ncbi:hypothetical protein QWZ13_15895 [Reinekea marina]|uniref:Uncharacterized protein n=1 Tax=Reinekea marina TaxID=1310421 RepID=A0ABV7WQ24_9GAMM|nr:hypothetical protein [Reinekea marina]MBU2863698.1 hypothetical protein [Reinekea forsetii]MDN3650390.1 hypothetical protein [Reinekea marina]